MIRYFKSGRTGYYYAQYSLPNGKRKQISCKTTNLRTAEAFAIRKVGDIQKSFNDPIEGCLISEFAERYLRSLAKHLSGKTILNYQYSFSQLIKCLKDIPMQKISVNDLYHFLYEEQPSTQTAAKHYRQLSRAFNIAKRWKLINENPLDEVDKPKPIERRKDTFTPEEFTELITSLPTHTYFGRRLKRIIQIGRLTGARASEVFNIEKDKILLEEEVLLITNSSSFRTKSGKNRYIPLSQNAIEIIVEQLEENRVSENLFIRNSKYLFPSEKGVPLSLYTVSPRFKQIVTSLFPNKDNLCFHSLRATFITYAVNDGVPLAQIQMAVGHKTVRTTEGYINYENIKLLQLKRSLNNIGVD